MIISRTPYRISFFGGGTDYPSWYLEHGGSVLSTSIDKYCHIFLRRLPPFFEHKHRIVYSQIESVKTIEEIRHPVVRTLMQYLKISDGLEVHHDGDLPARSGIGSSSSFTVGLLNTLIAYQGERISKEDLARKAIYLEQKLLQEAVGSQDQIAAAYGGLNRIVFHTDGSFQVNPVVLSQDRKELLERHLMLFFTGQSRTASDIAKKQIENINNVKSELTTMQSMVDTGCNILQKGSIPIGEFGKLLDESWKLKRTLTDKITTSEIDQIYKTALKAGALGGKLIGAGGGGFILFFVEPGLQPKVREKLKNLVEVNFRFESSGSSIVLYDPDLKASDEEEIKAA